MSELFADAKPSLKTNLIIEGDCLEVMKTFPRKSLDLVLTDPPFFLPATHYQSRVQYQRNFADLSPLRVFWSAVTIEVRRILKPNGHFLTFCNCDSYPVFFEPMYNNFTKLVSLVWNKKRIGLGNIWRHQHELIIAARNDDFKFNDTGKMFSDVISEEASLSEDREHPVEKPWKMLVKLIEPVTFKGDVVLDPFCGSGTTCLAAQILDRQFIGIELNHNYVDIARKKCHVNSQTLDAMNLTECDPKPLINDYRINSEPNGQFMKIPEQKETNP